MLTFKRILLKALELLHVLVGPPAVPPIPRHSKRAVYPLNLPQRVELEVAEAYLGQVALQTRGARGGIRKAAHAAPEPSHEMCHGWIKMETLAGRKNWASSLDSWAPSPPLSFRPSNPQ